MKNQKRATEIGALDVIVKLILLDLIRSDAPVEYVLLALCLIYLGRVIEIILEERSDN